MSRPESQPASVQYFQHPCPLVPTSPANSAQRSALRTVNSSSVACHPVCARSILVLARQSNAEVTSARALKGAEVHVVAVAAKLVGHLTTDDVSAALRPMAWPSAECGSRATGAYSSAP